MPVSVLKPGLIVSLKTEMRGGVDYLVEDLDVDKPADGVAARERWVTTKTVEDPEEHKKASKARSKCGSLIRAVCVQSAFGLICPEQREKELTEAIAEARATADRFNSTARTVQIKIYVLVGRVAKTDDEAVRAMSSELRELLDKISDGVARADVEAIRDAATRAKKMGAMLDDSAAIKVTKAVDEAREAAKKIAKQLVADSSKVADTVAEIKLDAIKAARGSFLDLDDDIKVAMPAAPGRAVDLDSTEDEAEPRLARCAECGRDVPFNDDGQPLPHDNDSGRGCEGAPQASEPDTVFVVKGGWKPVGGEASNDDSDDGRGALATE